MNYELIIFDVDGVIAEVGKPVERTTAELLVNLEKKGLRIAFASGKNISYLLGLARGIGLSKPLVIGENGCVIFDSITLREIKLAKRTRELDILEKEIIKVFNDQIWLQPNQVQLTIFPKDLEKINEIKNFLIDFISKNNISDLDTYIHVDAIDILPKGVNKGSAVQKIMELYNISREAIIAVGDSESDIPMLLKAGLPICIGEKIRLEGCKRFNNIREALNYLGSYL